ncbi:lysine--tRNA ligase [Gammaproteobacteria bacterium]|nr:lysine--tRNA ligase [Gammaproteobacteria bacterium]MDA7735420.1 lysine--tRNA ligase [Gammaproteobacteria bacterium]MDA7801062.1 lysine--tRNA ligase [Gammaproteobacteria bacterium]MDA7818846.1 lysine--tRNA ligase [Gammaproteobacteria bacterium]MDA8862553.1 lysine--tRNA ligase [Gammaproteobacteria bacterium]|tara:strand:- start:120 stop:1553 length:1434 start_codon:yes stop_codon:yes gene_type:complete
MSEENIGGEEGIIEERRKKLEVLRNNKKAYVNNFLKENYASDIHSQNSTFTKEELVEKNIENISVAGRVVLMRVMGNASFATIRDSSGDIQIYVSKNTVPLELYEDFKTWDLGDIIGVKGKLFKTRTDELTIEASDVILITKSIRPMPDKFKGLSDIETRYRQRYLDLMSNEDSKEVFINRTKIIESVRNSLKNRDFIEVETPMMHPIPGGAVARPFVTKHNALDRELFLRIAPELYLKRLLVGGFERVFEINRSFRNEGLSTRHNPEFTMLEYYEAFTTLEKTIEFTENMIKSASDEINDGHKVMWGNDEIDLSNFRKCNLTDLVLEENKNISKEDINKLGGKELLELFESTVEDKLIQPTFVIGYPVEVSPLSRRNNENPNIADRFELFIGGKEIANGFCELNDPDDQAERFKEQVKAKDTGDKEAMSYDEDYIIALEHGMPPAVGVGIGIDRLVMMITNQTSIRDVLLFPQLKS